MSNIKVYELAKELDMSSKDLMEKIQSMGIEAKSHMSVVKDMDATAVKNTILRGKSDTETKIVKVASKHTNEHKDEGETRVVVKAATNVSNRMDQKRVQPQRPVEKAVEHRHEKQDHKPHHSAITERNPQGHGEAKKSESTEQKTQRQGDSRPASNKPKGQEQVGQGGRVQGNRQQGQAHGQSQNHHQGQSQGSRPQGNYQGQSQSRPQGQSQGQPQGRSQGQSQGYNQGQSQGRSQGQSQGYSQGQSQGRSQGQSQGYNQGQSQGRSQGQSQGHQHSAANKQFSDKPNANKTDGKKPQGRYNNQNKNQKNAEKPVYSAAHLAQKQRSKGQRPKPAPKPIEPEINLEEMEPGTKIINVPITVAGFAEQIEKSTTEIIMHLMKMGIMANINQNLDEDTVQVIGAELGVPIHIGKVHEEIVEEGLETHEDSEEDLKPRPPIITVMGHVDHGKTSLLDAIRKTNVASGESGGITQHIGASEVSLNGQKIVFLDTPGHEAFTAMRARGAHVTDIAVLVVAADDSVKPQTVESISHAKAAGVPIIVAVNKMDKPGANPDKVKQDLSEHGILIEEWGGDTICVPVSAKSGEGIIHLLEMILLQAEILELKGNPHRLAMGTVIEARMDKTRGVVATLIVLNGTLKSGMSVVAGTCAGKIKVMQNHLGEVIKKAGPATAVEILGLSEIPEAGDEFYAVREDKVAREIAENRRVKLREEVLARNSSTTLEKLFSQMEEGEVKDLNLIIKGDVQGSVGALTSSLEKLKNENIHVRIIYAGVGAVTESDIMLANTSGAIIIAFNVRPSTPISALAEREGVEIRTYRVIYNVIDEVESAMKGMLDPVFKEVVLGKIQVRETFKVPGIGVIAGAYVLEGKVERNAEIRLVRDGIVIHEGKISSLKRFKDDAKEVSHGYECGIGIENYNDIKEGDIIEAFKMQEVERK